MPTSPTKTPSTQASLTQALSDEGVSIWLDDLSRHALTTGGLSELIGTRNVVGVTTNPTIFAAALSRGTDYHAQIATLSRSELDLDAVALELISTDVADACKVFADLYSSTGGRDGRVSIEVDPRWPTKPTRPSRRPDSWPRRWAGTT